MSVSSVFVNLFWGIGMVLQVFEGSILETVARSYQAIQEKSGDEYDAMSKCTAAMSQIESLEKEAEGATGDGIIYFCVQN